MLPLTHPNLTKEQVISALLGRYGSRYIDFRFDLLNKEDQRIGDVSHLVVADSSTIDMDNEAEIHRTAKFQIKDTGEINYLSDRIQPFARLRIRNETIEFPLGVFLLSTPEKSYQQRVIYRNVEAYDKLQILIDDGFTARYVADEGEYVTDVITDIIQSTGVTQINIEKSDVQLPTWFSWDPDTSRLEVINSLLQAINYEKIYVDEYGYFTSRPYRNPSTRSSEFEYKTDQWSVITPGATALQDFFAVPNQWVGVISEPDRVPLTYTYENMSPDSPTSIPARGRTVTKYIDVDAADITSLQGIVQKQAFQDSQVYTEMTFQTAIMPMHSHKDIYRLQHDILGVNAKFQELGWSMTLAAGATMSHRAREIITV
ncbi:hypothetical protein [Jeotgalibacillus salarius]|uniref:DUF5048 domain-containing protein n=1 Tax=Jeotgalibacillus salarius TaxID=546023 RepID=A0A4Y8LN64_9BACL|nr:hypothetical protein [Jeotgalibacillus salarius]TFE02891.1 hypothetical protein E2626_03540 [Jeotgalibacillus salarius]